MSRKMKFKRVLLCALLISLPLLSITNNNSKNIIDENRVEMCYETDTISIDNIILNKIISPKDSIKNELIEEVENYVFMKSYKTHKDVPSLIVDNGLNHNIDIAFMLAQTQLETNFGTLGAGRQSSRHSLFGVAIKKYGNYDEAIDDYCKMLKEKYLTKGRNEQHLLQKYTTTKGGRYATNPNYEKELRNVYYSIDRITKIKELQSKYNSM